MDYNRHVQMMLNSLRYLLTICVNILVLILIIYGISQLCFESYRFCYEIFGTVVAEEAPGQDQTFTVAQDDTMYDVALHLEQENLIVNRYSFFLRTQLMDPDAVILRPGTYQLNTSMDYEEIINQLTTSV